jgi:hypothetical protein
VYVIYPMLGGGGARPKDMYQRKVEVTAGARTKVAIDATPGPITLSISVKTDRGTPIARAQVVAIQATTNPQTLAELRDGTELPSGETIVPVYLRGVTGGAAEIGGMRPGAHTVCAMLGNPTMSTPRRGSPAIALVCRRGAVRHAPSCRRPAKCCREAEDLSQLKTVPIGGQGNRRVGRRNSNDSKPSPLRGRSARGSRPARPRRTHR